MGLLILGTVLGTVVTAAARTQFIFRQRRTPFTVLEYNSTDTYIVSAPIKTFPGTEGMITYGGMAHGDNAGPGGDDDDNTTEGNTDSNDGDGGGGGGGGGGVGTGGGRLELTRFDGSNEVGPPFEFEFLDPNCPGPGSLLSLVDACMERPYFNGSGAAEGLKSVQTIDAMYRSALSGRAERVG